MLHKTERQKRVKTPEQALASLMRLCARGERSSGDALRLMRGWGVPPEDARKVLARLVAERFIDDGRYAAAFVRDKMNLSGWGAGKIRTALRAKGVAAEIVDEALRQMAGTDMCGRLQPLMERRLRTLKYSSPYDARTKLIRFALSRGYDYATAKSCADAVVPADGSGDDDGVFGGSFWE